jgi:hypothetical protein
MEKANPEVVEKIECDICFGEIDTCEKCCEGIYDGDDVYCHEHEHYCESCKDDVKGSQSEVDKK